MVGTIVNVTCIVVGSCVGSVLRRGVSEKYQNVLYNAMGLASLVLGFDAFSNNIGNCEYPVLFILSLAIGGVVGTMVDIDGKVQNITQVRSKNNFIEGLTTASLLFCVGTFSIVGPILSALNSDNTYLYTNATLDLVTSAIFAATYGWGIMLAALILLLWQGSFYCIALFASDSIVECGLISDMSTIGGVLIVCSGLSILKLKDCKTLNMLPSLLVPVLWHIIRSFF